jgi:hypothetical protein
MITATLTGRTVLAYLFSLLLFLTVACTDSKIKEKNGKLVPPSPNVKPSLPHEEDTARKPTQDSVKKPVRMMNYKSFRKTFTLHKKGYVVSLLSKLYKA